MQYGIIPSVEIQKLSISFWQSPTWQQILIESAQAEEVFYFGNLTGSFLLIEIRSIGFGFYGAFSLGISEFQIQKHESDVFFTELTAFLKKKGILYFQIEPLDHSSLELDSKNTPYKKFLTPYTRVIDLNPDEEVLLATMPEKGRYNIRLAAKKGVIIEQAKFSSENIDIWMQLLDETVSRDGFSGNSREYYESFVQKIEQNNEGGLYFARKDGRVIAAGIFVFTPSRAIYYYGVSSSDADARKVHAPYLIQWEMIRLAKSRNIPLYDFLGVATPGDENDSLAGVSFFKSRFGGSVVELPRKFLLPFSWKYPIFHSIQNIKNLLKRR